MPIHDWRRVSAGRFHHVHCLWIAELSNALNGGLLPPTFYAMAEQDSEEAVLDVPADEAVGSMKEIALRPRVVVVRSAADDHVVALIEVLCPGNKSSGHALRSFVAKAVEALERGHHLLLIDLHAPTSRDPQGIHGAIWETFSDGTYRAPEDKRLTLVAYASGKARTAYIEPIAVGDLLPPMPLFLDPDQYVYVPLEETYQAAFRGVPLRWRGLLEA